VVPTSAGSTTDSIARLITNRLSGKLKQQFVIDNRPIAHGNVGISIAASSLPDGHTLVIAGLNHFTVNPLLYKSVGFTVDQFDPVAMIGMTPSVLVVNPLLPVNTLFEFTKFVKTNNVNYGSSGYGSTMHLAGELFQILTETHMTHIIYPSQPLGLYDIIGNRIHVMFSLLPSSIHFINNGSLKAIAVLSEDRVDILKNTPTTKESGLPKLIAVASYGVFVSHKTSAKIISLLNKEINEILKDKEKVSQLGIYVIIGQPNDLAKTLSKEQKEQKEFFEHTKIKIE
jgi:tripartite-type tricarboxylate transporter receptor subunit TctC